MRRNSTKRLKTAPGKIAQPLSHVTPTTMPDLPPSTRTRSKSQKSTSMSVSDPSTPSLGEGTITSRPSALEVGIVARSPESSGSDNTDKVDIEAWVRQEYRRSYCDQIGNLQKPPNFAALRMELHRMRPNHHCEINEAIRKYVSCFIPTRGTDA